MDEKYREKYAVKKKKKKHSQRNNFRKKTCTGKIGRKSERKSESCKDTVFSKT